MNSMEEQCKTCSKIFQINKLFINKDYHKYEKLFYKYKCEFKCGHSMCIECFLIKLTITNNGYIEKFECPICKKKMYLKNKLRDLYFKMYSELYTLNSISETIPFPERFKIKLCVIILSKINYYCIKSNKNIDNRIIEKNYIKDIYENTTEFDFDESFDIVNITIKDINENY
jgi:hypothetical protein